MFYFDPNLVETFFAPTNIRVHIWGWMQEMCVSVHDKCQIFSGFKQNLIVQKKINKIYSYQTS